jgi:hypothetical protein
VIFTNLGNGFWFTGFLRVVCSNTFGLDTFHFRILFIIVPKEINLLIILLFFCSRSGFCIRESFPGLARTGKCVELASV